MKTIFDFTQQLQGITYDESVSSEKFDSICSEARENGVVIIYGYAGKTIIKGAINDEVKTRDNDIIRFTRDGVFKPDPYCEKKKCRYVELANLRAAEVTVLCKKDLSYKTHIPHEPFYIMKDGNVCCKGILIMMYDLPK